MPKAESLPQIDPLGEALNFLRMSETTYYHSELAAPWGLVMPEKVPKFHFVTSGRCWLQIEGFGDRLLEAGDFVVVPHGNGHRLASAPSAPSLSFDYLTCEKISARYALYRKDGGGPVTTIICGDLNFNQPAAQHLVSRLPKFMHIRAPANHAIDWLRETMQFMASEARDLRPGSEAIVTRLADVLVIQAIRFWIEQHPGEQTGWLGALRDRNISRALGLIHREPERPWTLPQLASAVAMSRSAFAARFSSLVGEPVKHYLTRWRMHLAHVHLNEGLKTLDEIALELGYNSGAAFSRAFKRSVGTWPGSVKREKARARRPSPHRTLKKPALKSRIAVA